MDQKTTEDEVDRNYDAFANILSLIIDRHRGEFALMKGGEIAEFFSDQLSALRAGRSRFPDQLFSIQEVTDRPVDLGFFSHAVDSRIA